MVSRFNQSGKAITHRQVLTDTKRSLLIEFSRSVGAVVSLVRMLRRLRWRDQASTSSRLWIWLKLYGKNVNYDKFVRHIFRKQSVIRNPVDPASTRVTWIKFF